MSIWTRITARRAARRDLQRRHRATRDALAVSEAAFRRVIDTQGHLPVWAARNALNAIEGAQQRKAERHG